MISKMIFVLFAGLVGCWINEYGVSASSTTTREPSIQAYGLPKRIITENNNGYIERIHLGDRMKPKDSRRTGERPFSPVVRRKFAPRVISTNSHDSDTGDIEIFHLDSNKEFPSAPRSVRSILIDENEMTNVSNDLQADETKVFRPLFVYRQQVMRRQRSDRARRNNNVSSTRSNKKSTQLRYRPRDRINVAP